MTADVDAYGVGEVSEAPKGDVEEKGSYQDLRRENNGVMIINGSNANKDDADGSYVFVNGSDAVSDDHVEPLDLNGEHVENLGSGGVAEVEVVENGECNENNGGGGGSQGSECEIKEGQVGGSDGVGKENGSEAVGEFEPQPQPQLQPQRVEVEEKIMVEESSEDAREITRPHPVVPDAAASELCESSMQVHDGKAEDNNLDSTAESELLEIDGEEEKVEEEEEDMKPDLPTEGKENHQPWDIISVDVQNDLDQENVVTDAAESELCESSMQVHAGKAEDNNLDSIAESELLEIDGEGEKVEEEEDRKPDLSREGKENNKPRDIISVDVQNDENVVPDAAESELCESLMQVHDGKAEDNNLDSTAESDLLEIYGEEEKDEEEEDRKPDYSTEGKESHKSRDIISKDVQNDLDQENVVPDAAESELCQSSMQVRDGKAEDNKLVSTAESDLLEIDGEEEKVEEEEEDRKPDYSTEGKESHESRDIISVDVQNDLDEENVVPDAAESELCESLKQVRDGKAEDNNLDSTAESELLEINGEEEKVEEEEEDRKPDLSTEGKDNQESRDIISVDVQIDLGQENVVLDADESELCESSMQVRDGKAEDNKLDSTAESELLEIDGEEERVEEEDRKPSLSTEGKENHESRDIISVDVENDLYQEEAPELETNEVPLERSAPGALVVDMEKELETEVGKNGPVSIENGDGSPGSHTQDSPSETLDSNQKTAEQNGSSENAESLPSPPFVCGNAAANEIPVEVDSAEHEVDLEQSSKTEVVFNENGDCLPTNHDQDSISESSVNNDLVGAIQNTPKQNGSSQNVDCLPSPVVCGNVLLESGESFPTAPGNDTVVKEDAENGASPITEKFLTCVSDNEMPGTGGTKRNERPDSCPADHTQLEIQAENCPNETIKAENGPDYGILSCHAADNAKSETETGSVAIDPDEKVTDFPTDALKKGSEVSNVVIDCADGQPHSVAATVVECHVNGFVESDLSTSLGAAVKSEPEVENTPILSSRDMPCDDDIESESKVPDGSANLTESALNCVPDVDVEDRGDQFTGTDSGEKPSSRGAKGVSGIHGDETSTTSPEGSTNDALEGQNAEVVKRPFYYLIRLPRYDDESLREQIKHAQLQVYEKTQNRDAIRANIQMKRATWKEYGDNFEATLSEERAARDLLRSKRQEMDSAQSLINRVKNAMSVEDIDGTIRSMEHAIQHETLPLKEEKQLIREIKQLKQLREQISSNMGRQDDVLEALDQKDQIEARLKFLRKEMDILRDNLQKAEAVTKTVRKKYNDESEKWKELQAQFKAADDIRQEAYAHLQSLKKQLYEKNKHFWKYKDDSKAATDLASKVKREELQRLCVNQVEKVMELWNKNDEFRKEYIRCNTRSTLRRLRTLDGRSLGPDEEPPLIPHVVYERVAKDNSVPPQSAVEQEKLIVLLKTEKAKEKTIDEDVEQKKQTTKSEKPLKPAPLGNGLATVSGRDEIEEAREEEPKQTKEEEELARKMKELRREEEAAKLRERHLLEEKAKAKEALERKKRNAEKANVKAMLRAHKEAEQKEKEREKKARKKERKKAAAVAIEGTDGANEGESAPSSETPTESPQESETREKSMTATKRSQKPSQFTKQGKAKSIPAPLRNRSKRRMQPWMWVLLTALVVLALFLVGNSSFSLNFGLQRFGF